MNICLIGPSGVGKGSHATTLVNQFGFSHLVTGELLHDNLDKHTAVGFLARHHVERGDLVPDEVVAAMVAEYVWNLDPEKGVLFDGFPRTIDQAYFLDGFFADIGRNLDAVIYLHISDDAVESRLLGRLVCQACQTPFHVAFNPPKKEGCCDACGSKLVAREDDIKEMIKVRLRNFNRVLQPVLDYYSETNRLYTIDGESSMESVGRSLVNTIAEIEQGTNEISQVHSISFAETLPDHAAAPPGFDAADKSFNLILVGGPGSGKGTQAEQLQASLGLAHVASGDLFRENLNNSTPLGTLAKKYMDRGELVPDDVTEAMVEERLGRPDVDQGFILDGFPRTLSQAHALTEIMSAAQRRIDGVVYLKVSDAAIVRRISGRLICRECQTPYHTEFKPPKSEGVCDGCGGDLYQRDDDNAKTVRARLKAFHAQTAPIVDYYRDAGLLVEIDGEGALDEVVSRSRAAAEDLRRQKVPYQSL